ncbi:hypothetical protein EVAR_2417_1 [Eumeta japonica]|uniref:Uncharacterized protein n=1 Tax=Eumeta variegata TaxID=151549 RepID=A0A4C1SR49_EUMVA|nr:hypothetical protein EVAR_2417_1 [Eumeta japonica]
MRVHRFSSRCYQQSKTSLHLDEPLVRVMGTHFSFFRRNVFIVTGDAGQSNVLLKRRAGAGWGAGTFLIKTPNASEGTRNSPSPAEECAESDRTRTV